MELLNPDARHAILGSMRRSTFQSSLCECSLDVTVPFRIEKVLTIAKSFVAAQCSIIKVDGFMKPSFYGIDLTGVLCEHDRIHDFVIRFTNVQWEAVARHSDILVATGAKFHEGRLQIPSSKGAILPLDRRMLREVFGHSKSLTVAEMFCGGFSGWSYGLQGLVQRGISLHHLWGIDRDADCIKAYSITHQPHLVGYDADELWTKIRGFHENGKVPHTLIHADIKDKWWLTLFPDLIEVLVASPPCPPWVVTNDSPGFNRSDGLTLLSMLECIALIRPCIVVIEEVATIMKHAQWPIIQAMIGWANYRVHACHALNLIDHAPQNRNRCIMILVDQLVDLKTDHVFDKWPVSSSQSLRTYKAILRETSFWHETVTLSKKEFELYNDFRLVPKDATLGGHAKRAMRDLQTYRFRTIDQTAACFMTSYGRPCDIADSLIQKGGLYGSLLHQSGVIRKFATPEIIFLQGAIKRCWVSCNIREAMKILGNSISVAHATWGLINAVKMIYVDPLPKTIDVLFLDIIGDRLHAENFTFSCFDGGYLFTETHEDDDSNPLDGTQTMLSFSKVIVTSPMQEYGFTCVEGTSIFQALCAVLGESLPQKIEFQPGDLQGYRLSITPDIQTGNTKFQICAGVPSRLILSEKAFRLHQPEIHVICILLTDTCIVMPRTSQVTLIDDVALTLFRHEDHSEKSFIFRDLGGCELGKNDECPDAVFAFPDSISTLCDEFPKFAIVFEQHHMVFRAFASMDDISCFLHFVKRHGVLDFIHAIGWQFLPITSIGGQPAEDHLLCVPIEGRLSMSSEAFRGVLKSRIFSVLMNIYRTAGPQVWVKLWDTFVWKGTISGQSEMGVILKAWYFSGALFGESLDFRMVANGLNITPETCIRDVLLPHQTLMKVNLILSLHGGGKATKPEDVVRQKNSLAAFLLDAGADISEISNFVEKAFSVAGFQAVHHIVQIKNHDTKMDALTKLSTSLSIPLPSMSKAKNQRKDLVRKKVNESQIRHPIVDANSFKLQPGFFRNRDGTECVQIDCIQSGKSGIMLMNPKEAIPWLQNGNTISQDELGILILGECPASDCQQCKRIKTPAFDAKGQPVILSTCLHNLGSQPIGTGAQETSADVAVMSTLVFSVTAFKDELEPSKWEELIGAPVKVCFELLAQAGCKLVLPWPPWGRSWRNALGKSTPSLSESFQVHIRVPWKDKDDVFKASGFNGIYTAPKTEDHSIDPSYAIVWLDGTVADLKVKAATCHEHCGLVKLVKSRGKKVSRGIRFPHELFAKYHEILKPGIVVPKPMQCNHFAKLTPTPIGASQEEVQAWLTEVAWEARPIKPLGSRSWLIGAADRFTGTFAVWNDQMLILTWLPPRTRASERIVVSGAPVSSQQSLKHESGGPRDAIFETDPWAQYHSGVKNGEHVVKSNDSGSKPSNVSNAIARAPPGPIEERFKIQDQQISELKSSIQAMSSRIDQQESQNEQFKCEVRKDLTEVKHEVANQCRSFEETLHRSLRRQDQNLTEAFSELKALFLEKPLPNKKAKATPPAGQEDEDEMGDI